MKLGVLYEPESANAHYRAIIPVHALQRRGHSVVWPRYSDALPMREFADCDLVHAFRRIDLLDDLRRLSARGVAISFDNDDDYVAADVSKNRQGLETHRFHQQVHRETIKAARLADLTTTPSASIAERYRAAGIENVAVVGNYLASNAFGFGSRSKHEGVVVGWIAGREHKFDLERLPIVNVLERLLETHAELQVLTVGVRLPLHTERYKYIVKVEFEHLFKVISSIDIGIAPLADTAFNQARSNVKLKEYSSGGAMWLASPVGPYRGLGEQQGGLLVGDEDWFSTLDVLIRSPFKRKRLARRALKWAKTQTIDLFSPTWEELFRDAIARAAHREGATSQQPQASRSTARTAQRR
jgi:hypothetical protein